MAETPDSFQIVNGWLAQHVGHHTCGTAQGGHFGAHEPGCGWEPICKVSELPALLAPRSELEALEGYVGALLSALEDARAYRLGEASGLDDPDLDLDDRQHLLRYEDAERTLVAVVDVCTRCGHRHLVECDGITPDRDPEGDHAPMHCGCPEPETAADFARYAATPSTPDPWATPGTNDEPPF